MIKNGDIILITTDNWFYAKDGQQYKAAWGKAEIIHAKDMFGFNLAHSANWFLKVGTQDDALYVAGCQIHYVQACPERPVGTHVLKLK